jgi:hypothetical protein
MLLWRDGEQTLTFLFSRWSQRVEQRLLKQAAYGDAVAAGDQVSKLVNDNLRHGSRQSVFGTLPLAAGVGGMVGRRP